MQLLVNADINLNTTLVNFKELQQLLVKKISPADSVLWPLLDLLQADYLKLITCCSVIYSVLCSTSFLHPARSPERKRDDNKTIK